MVVLTNLLFLNMRKVCWRARILLAALPMFVIGVLPLPAASWEDEKKTWDSEAGVRSEKDPGYAAKLSLNFLPVDNGHFYVGEVSRGIWFSVGQTLSLAAVAVPLLNSQSRSRQERRPVWTQAMVGIASGGGVGYLALKVWAAFDAAAGARRFNKALAEQREKKQGFHWDLSPDGIWVTRRWG